MYFHNCFKRMSERGFKEVKDEITFPRKVNKNASWWIDGWIRVTSHPANSKWSDWRVLLMLINSANLFIASWLRLITNINTSSCFFLHGRWKKCLRVFFCFNDEWYKLLLKNGLRMFKDFQESQTSTVMGVEGLTNTSQNQSKHIFPRRFLKSIFSSFSTLLW